MEEAKNLFNVVQAFAGHEARMAACLKTWVRSASSPEVVLDIGETFVVREESHEGDQHADGRDGDSPKDASGERQTLDRLSRGRMERRSESYPATAARTDRRNAQPMICASR